VQARDPRIVNVKRLWNGVALVTGLLVYLRILLLVLP
jgi:hypothetical protein